MLTHLILQLTNVGLHVYVGQDIAQRCNPKILLASQILSIASSFHLKIPKAFQHVFEVYKNYEALVVINADQ